MLALANPSLQQSVPKSTQLILFCRQTGVYCKYQTIFSSPKGGRKDGRRGNQLAGTHNYKHGTKLTACNNNPPIFERSEEKWVRDSFGFLFKCKQPRRL